MFVYPSTLVLIFSFLISFSFSYAKESVPNYSVSISIPKRNIFGAQRINVTFSIVGMGNVSFGSVYVVSDATNILVNTYWLQSFIVGGETLISSEKIGPAEQKETKAIYAVLSVPSVNLPNGTQQIIHGQFQIDTSGMDPGTYGLKVVFLVQLNNENYVFQDAIEYRIIDTFEAYPILQYIIPAILSTIFSLALTEYRIRRERKKKAKL